MVCCIFYEDLIKGLHNPFFEERNSSTVHLNADFHSIFENLCHLFSGVIFEIFRRFLGFSMVYPRFCEDFHFLNIFRSFASRGAGRKTKRRGQPIKRALQNYWRTDTTLPIYL